MRRAEYSEGSGLLVARGDRLFFLSAVDHPAAASLMEAADSDRPLRALAVVVAGAEFNVPPFIFLQATAGLQSIVCGAIQLEVNDTEMSLVDGAVADPWAHLRIPETATVSTGGQIADGLWVESGVVRAGAFRWSPHTEASAPSALSHAAGSARQPASAPAPKTDAELESTAPTSSTPSRQHEAPVAETPVAETPVAETPVAETPPSTDADATVEAVRTAKSRNERADVSSSTAPGLPTGADATVDLAPGEVLLDEPDVALRTVEALICLECDSPNPPMTARCRSCSALLSEANSDLRTVAQPCLGKIHLSGGGEELLDADLLIGRNPAREALEPHQRAVVHGTGDRSISRRHIEIRLDGWQVIALNLKKGSGTTVESRLGGCTKLVAGVPHELAEGDTVQFGGAWLRYEEGV